MRTILNSINKRFTLFTRSLLIKIHFFPFINKLIEIELNCMMKINLKVLKRPQKQENTGDESFI